jgi:hypothetical protein
MMIIAGLEYLGNHDVVENLTLYPRPPVFFKRPSGQFVASALTVTALALTPPAYYYVASKANETRNTMLQDKEIKLNKEMVKYKSILGKKRKEISALDSNIKELQLKFSSKEKTLTSVYDKKVHYRLKSEQIGLFAGDLAKHGVKTYNIETDADGYSLSLVSPSDKNITQLITDISQKYADEISSVDIEVIQKDKNSTFYQGVLKVVLQ